MAMKFKVGQTVREIMPAPREGTITKFVGDETSGDWHAHVAVADENGDTHDQSMPTENLEAVTVWDEASQSFVPVKKEGEEEAA